MRRDPIGRGAVKLWIAAGLLAVAAALRFAALDAGWFGVDQARDLAWGERIATGEALPVAGPAMRSRVHLGATYYVFWALPALVEPGPRAAYAFAAGLGVVAVAATGWLTRRLAGDAAALVALAWLATSPVAVIDSRIAWAPAALPPFCAALLLVARSLLAAPTRSKAAGLAALAALGTQLHLAAAALAPVAAAAVVARGRTIGVAGFALAALAAAIPLVPMLVAATVPVATTPAAGRAAAADVAWLDPQRVGDVVTLAARWVDGLSPAAPLRPRGVDVWLSVERAAGVLPLVALPIALVAARGARDRAGLLLVAAAFVACVAVPVLLPLEVWGYYLDGALVPAAVLVGIAATRGRWRGAGIGVVGALCAGRVLLLCWWIATASGQGFVAANLDYLRIGGPRPTEPAARARLLGWGVKERAAQAIAADLGIRGERIWRDVSGPGFDDLDSDNGYFLRRAAQHAGTPAPAAGEPAPGATPVAAPASGGGLHAAVLYRGELPGDWLAAMRAPEAAGPLDVRGFTPLVRTAAARLPSCGGGPPPRRTPPDPLDYGAGEPRLPRWPCDWPVVELPVDAAPPGVAVRVFPRVLGAGRIVAMEAEPAATTIRADAPGFGDGMLLAAGGGRIRLRLAIDGPALLDLVELQGRAADEPEAAPAVAPLAAPQAPGSPRSPSPSPAPPAGAAPDRLG